MNDYYEIRATFKEYPGNFDRELTLWVFGLEDDYMPGGVDIEALKARPHAEAMEWAGGGEMEGSLMSLHEDFARFVKTLDSESLEWRLDLSICLLDGEPTDEQWQTLIDAIKSFPEGVTLVKIELTAVVATRAPIRALQVEDPA